MLTHDPRSDSYLLHTSGHIAGGAAPDANNAWTYWLASEGARRRPAKDRADALARLGVA
jgi:hypothetical protein